MVQVADNDKTVNRFQRSETIAALH